MKSLRIAMLCGLLFLLSACGTGDAGAQTDALAPDEAHRLTVYTSHKEEVYGPIVKEFEERTGVWVQVVTGGTNELLERIAVEADKPACDVMFGGGVESLMTYADFFEPYTCSEADLLKPDLRPDGDRWTPFSSLPVVLIYNTKLVADGAVTGWSDLLAPRWRGRIAFADPAVSGSSYTAMVTMLTCLPGDHWTILEQFVENLDGTVLEDSGDVVAAVTVGTASLGVTLEQTALKQQAQGADIAIVYPREGTSNLPDGTALVAGAPHGENARAFLEFTQSRDVQSLVVNDFARRSVRVDVADRDSMMPESSVRFIDYDVAWASELTEELLERWAALCREETP